MTGSKNKVTILLTKNKKDIRIGCFDIPKTQPASLKNRYFDRYITATPAMQYSNSNQNENPEPFSKLWIRKLR